MTTTANTTTRAQLLNERAEVRERLRNYGGGDRYSDSRLQDIARDSHLSLSLLIGAHVTG